MNTRIRLRRPAPVAAPGGGLLVLFALFLLTGAVTAPPAAAVPFHAPTIDGIIAGNGTDWDPADRVVDDSGDDDIVRRQQNVRRLWLTWDANQLYVGCTYQDFVADDAFTVYLDLGRGRGPANAALLDSLPANVTFPAGHNVDFVIGRYAAQTYPGFKPRAFLVTDATGSVQPVSGAVTCAQANDAGGLADSGKRWPLWNNVEFAIPWSVLYPDLGGGVPPLAVIKALAFVGHADATRNGLDPAPNNVSFDNTTAVAAVTNLHASVVDFTGDGVPDPLAASLAGTVTLSDGATGPAVTATAVLLDFPRATGAALSTITTAAGVRAWTLARLPAGRYAVTTSAPGYFPATTTVDLAAGQALTGVDQTLQKKTAIRGVVRFASRGGRAGTLELRDAASQTLDSRAISAADTTFEFTVATGGSYTLHAEADTYLPADLPIDVTAGVDYTGAVVTLASQTRIAGHVGFAELVNGEGKPGTIWFRDGAGAQLGIGGFPYNGGDYEFFTPAGGTYRLYLETLPPVYVEVDTTFTVTTGVDVTGLDFDLVLKARVAGALAFDGPGAAGKARLWDSRGVKRDSLSFAAAGDTFAFYLEPGRFHLDLEATGYVPRSIPFVVSREDTSLGALPLAAVRATHLEIVDAGGAHRPEVRATYWDQAAGDPFTSTQVRLAARDDAGRDDLYDLGGQLQGFRLSARKMDDLSRPRGRPVFYRGAAAATVDSVVSFTNGRAEFWMSNTAVEVLRVYLAQPQKDPVAGRLIVAFQDPQPVTVVLTAARDTLVAGGVDTLRVDAQLYDSAQNPSLLPDVPVSFALAPGFAGSGQFESATVLTNAEGRATGVLSATGAGPVHITAAVAVTGQTLDVRGGGLEGTAGYLPAVVVPGETAGWRVSLPAAVSGLHDTVGVTALPIDAWGNVTGESGLTAAFAASPPAMGSFSPPTAVTGADGRAVASFVPAGTAGLASLAVSGAGLTPAEAGLQVRDVMVIPDAAWPDEPATRRTFDTTDLTALVVNNDADALSLEIPFASSWGGLQLHVIFETGFDAAGAGSDPFGQPVNYGQADRPDYALTMKYSAMDWGDFRAWNRAQSKWQWVNPDDGTWSDTGYSILAPWVRKLADRVLIRMPWLAFGDTAPDSLRMELYLTQDEGTKRAAFDSAPQDSTLNLTFDYNNPQTGDWDTAAGPTTLHAWGPTYVVKRDFPTPPTLSDAAAAPAEPTAGQPLTLTVQVTEAGDGVGDVLADLSALGGGDAVRLYDDGQSQHGDVTAGDGRFGTTVLVPIGNPGGRQDLVVSGWDASNSSASRDTVTVTVTPVVEPIIQATDPLGDDHGPNQPGVARKYYTYPTNIAFVPGGFDLTGLTVFETLATVGGVQVPMIAFQVGIADFPDPDDPGTADWNPSYADLNIEKIDILIDSAPGGATASLPNRGAAFQPWDAWDFAVIMDGWYKALIPSRGLNTLESWRQNALRADKEIMLIGDPDANTVTALVSKASLGDPTPEAIRSWDIAVCMSSHDFGGEEVLGGIRWVNEARSEWNFGGGQSNSDRDPNLVDLLLVPGTGHTAGGTQEQMLDYESEAALQRLADGLTPAAIEMSRFEDTGPPVVDTGGKGSVVTTVAPLADAPLALAFRITDDDRVQRAEFRYRSTDFAGGGWDREAPLGYLGNNVWVVDVLPTYLDSLVASPIDTTRYLEFEIEADDPATDNVPTVTPVTTLQILPTANRRTVATTFASENVSLLQVDGSNLKLSAGLRTQLVTRHLARAWTGGAVAADTMGSRVALRWTLGQAPAAARSAPTLPSGRPVGVFRTVSLATTDTLGGTLTYDGEWPGTAELSLHYPQSWLPAGTDEQRLAVYSYNAATDRWVLVGGNVTATGNNVTATVAGSGTYGLFVTDAVAPDEGEVLSGLSISPNPFSPNGDGLYDTTNISFYLSREATVTVEIYDISGSRRALLTETFPYAGTDLNDTTPHRVPGLIWDGRMANGEYVPYGVYVLRVIATYNQAGGTRTIRSNHSLAVIR